MLKIVNFISLMSHRPLAIAVEFGKLNGKLWVVVSGGRIIGLILFGFYRFFLDTR